MKKYVIFAFAFCVCVMSAGCFGAADIQSVISEKTTTFFFGENNGATASIAVGERENPYILDGFHNKMVDFSLVSISLNQSVQDDEIVANLIVNGQEKEYCLELNPLNMSYMTDIGYALSENDTVELEYENLTIVLANISKDFAVDYKKAVDIGEKNIVNIVDFKKNDKLACEGYIKLFEGDKFGGDGYYWCFSLLGQNGKSVNVLISVNNENDVFVG